MCIRDSWCTADIGWVTGHTYIAYGPLACGATEIVFEGVPTYPDAGRFWKVIQDHKVSIFSVSYTHLRAHETVQDLVCRLLLEKKKQTK